MSSNADALDIPLSRAVSSKYALYIAALWQHLPAALHPRKDQPPVGGGSNFTSPTPPAMTSNHALNVSSFGRRQRRHNTGCQALVNNQKAEEAARTVFNRGAPPGRVQDAPARRAALGFYCRRCAMSCSAFSCFSPTFCSADHGSTLLSYAESRVFLSFLK